MTDLIPFSMTLYLPQSWVAGSPAYSVPSTQAELTRLREKTRGPTQG